MKKIITRIARTIMKTKHHCGQCEHFNRMGKDNEGVWGICGQINEPFGINAKACSRFEKSISLLYLPVLIIIIATYNLYSFCFGKNCRNCFNYGKQEKTCSIRGQILDADCICTMWTRHNFDESERIINKVW